MSNIHLQTLKGFRDFLPQDKQRRDYFVDKLRQTFEVYGFLPLETPTLEYAELILGKYGTEADKLVYRFTDKGEREVALRYDQTVPTARVLAQYKHELPKFFRRYQIQNVFRAEKPQKGRYREFTQCDIDIFGSSDSLADAEVLATAYAGYVACGFTGIEVRLNDRQVLISHLQPFATEEVKIFDIIQSVDKLDKHTQEEVEAELVSKGLAIESAKGALKSIQTAQSSENLSSIMKLAVSLGVPESALIFTPTLARGLDYYTGMIFEVAIPAYGSGSLGGGGRYDNLIESLGGESTPATGFSFGFDRMIDAALTLGLLSDEMLQRGVMVTIFDDQSVDYSLNVANELRQKGIKVSVYPNCADNLGKQLKYADTVGFDYTVVCGPNEIVEQKAVLKDMKAQSQETLTLPELMDHLSKEYGKTN